MLHHGAEDLLRDVGHSGVGGWLPDEGEQDGVSTLSRQHATVAGGVLGTDVMDRPDCPQLDRLFLSGLQQWEEWLERSAMREIVMKTGTGDFRLDQPVGHHLLAGVGPVRDHSPELPRHDVLGGALDCPPLWLVTGQVSHYPGSEVGHLNTVRHQQLPQDVDEGVHQETGPQPGHLGDVVQQSKDLCFYGWFSWEGSENVKEEFHPFLVQENFTSPGRLVSEVPEGGESELESDVQGVVLHPPPHDGEELLHVAGVGTQLTGLLSRDLGCEDGADGHGHPVH